MCVRQIIQRAWPRDDRQYIGFLGCTEPMSESDELAAEYIPARQMRVSRTRVFEAVEAPGGLGLLEA